MFSPSANQGIEPRPDGGVSASSEDGQLGGVRYVSYSDFLRAAEAGEVREAIVTSTTVRGLVYSGGTIVTQVPWGADVADRLFRAGVNVTIRHPSPTSPFMNFLSSMLPLALLAGFSYLMMRRFQMGGQGGMIPFSRSRARQLSPDQTRVTFADVAGADEAREELMEVVDFLKDPSRFSNLGAKIPRGVLLVGPPGTGKTLLAKAVAGEANVPFFSISGSDFVEMFVGVGASRVRSMFEEARKHAPCIIFIDEIDAMGRHRGAGIGGGNDEREQTLNQMLVEMDGFEGNKGIIIMAATNRPDVLDPALLRPGRFDRQVTVPNPDVTGRKKILEVHARKVPLSAGVDLEVIARGTPGFSGADLANLVNEAALMAARRKRKSVGREDFDMAKDRILMGAERRSLRITEAERRLTAFHEAGHALLGTLLPGCDPVHKATIVPRGRALGVVISLPEGDQTTHSFSKLRDMLSMFLGGRAAEMEVFGPDAVTTGAASDIQQVTSMARKMVTEWGFSPKLGPIRYTENQSEVFLGHSVSRQQNVSEETAKVIDAEIRRIVEEAEKVAASIIREHRKALDALANALLERETLTGDEVRILVGGGQLPDLPKNDISGNPVEPMRWKGSVPSTQRGGLQTEI